MVELLFGSSSHLSSQRFSHNKPWDGGHYSVDWTTGLDNWTDLRPKLMNVLPSLVKYLKWHTILNIIIFTIFHSKILKKFSR